jgi:hypothetical protein
MLSRRVSAIRVLISFCRSSNVESAVGKMVVEHSLVRLVKLLFVSCQGNPKVRDYHAFTIPGVSFGELERLTRYNHIKDIMDQEGSALFIGEMVCDCLLPPSSLVPSKQRRDDVEDINDINPGIRELRYYRLYHFLLAFLQRSSSLRPSALYGGAIKLYSSLERVMPDILANLIHRCDYDSIMLFTGFVRHFLKEVRRGEERPFKHRGASRHKGALVLQHQEGSLGSFIYGLRAASVDVERSTLEEEIVNTCLGSDNLGRLLPEIFMRSNESNLRFFTTVCLKGRFTLKALIDSNPQPIVKGLCKKLGGDRETIGPAIHALKAAAIAIHCSTSAAEARSNSSEGVSKDQQTDLMASKLVTTHFMFLVVNLIQTKWKFKTDAEKLHSMRCLNAMLNFLLPVEAPQYIPQILATINAANEEGNDVSRDDKLRAITCAHMRLLAVEALSRFCHLVDQECLSQHLTNVVVSLIPALSQDPTLEESTQLRDLAKQASKAAVGLLEFLTEGELGKSLAIYFREIPFLPASSLLDKVRSNLKVYGVDFDNLLVMTQHTPSVFSGKERNSGAASVGSVDGNAASVVEAKQQNALSKRIGTVCSLLGNENASVRRVILEHLLNLLRANRTLFAALVENEGSSSLSRFLTVKYGSKDAEKAEGKSKSWSSWWLRTTDLMN